MLHLHLQYNGSWCKSYLLQNGNDWSQKKTSSSKLFTWGSRKTGEGPEKFWRYSAHQWMQQECNPPVDGGPVFKFTFQTWNLPYCALLALLWGHFKYQGLLNQFVKLPVGFATVPESWFCLREVLPLPRGLCDTCWHPSPSVFSGKSSHLLSKGLGEQITTDTIFFL